MLPKGPTSGSVMTVMTLLTVMQSTSHSPRRFVWHSCWGGGGKPSTIQFPVGAFSGTGASGPKLSTKIPSNQYVRLCKNNYFLYYQTTNKYSASYSLIANWQYLLSNNILSVDPTIQWQINLYISWYKLPIPPSQLWPSYCHLWSHGWGLKRQNHSIAIIEVRCWGHSCQVLAPWKWKLWQWYHLVTLWHGLVVKGMLRGWLFFVRIHPKLHTLHMDWKHIQTWSQSRHTWAETPKLQRSVHCWAWPAWRSQGRGIAQGDIDEREWLDLFRCHLSTLASQDNRSEL